MNEPEITSLAVIEPNDIQTVFTNSSALDPILQRIASEARSFIADVETATGRKSIASVAFKVAKSKTYLDGLGKELVDGLKDLPKKVDANRKYMRDFLDSLKDEVRKPLTEWEAEQARIEAEKAEQERLRQLREQVDRDHEFALLMDAEFDRKREEQRIAVERAQKENEERIAREAAERARIEAEAKAKTEQEAAMRREIEAKLATERAEKERAEAERRAKEAEEREAKAKREAAEREERVRQEAIRLEQERIAAEERRAKEEQEKREANRQHVAKINREIINDLAAFGFDESTSKTIIDAIVGGKIRHATISY